MRKVAVILVVLAVVAGGVLLFIGTAGRPLPDPPRPADTEGIDPLVLEAIDAAYDASTADPGSPALRADLAMVYHANAQLAAAVETYRQALGADDGRARWWFHLARAEAALGRYEDALASMARAAELERSYAPAHWHQGFWLLELGRLDDAYAAFETATEVAPDDPIGDVGRIGFARVHLARGEGAQAEVLLARLTQRFPDQPYLRQLLGTAYQQQGKLREAGVEASRATGVKPVWPDPWIEDVARRRTGYLAVFEEADRLFDQGSMSGAVARLQTLRTSRPNDAVLLTKIGETYLRGGNTAQARTHLDQALQVDDDYYYAHYLLSRLHQQANQLDRAMQHIDRAIASHPRLAVSHRHRAALLSQRADWAGAEASLREALRLGLQDLDAQVDLGVAVYRQGRVDEAVATIREVINQKLGHVGARVRLAVIMGETGNFDEADRLIGEARRYEPNNPDIRRAAQEILRMRDGG